MTWQMHLPSVSRYRAILQFKNEIFAPQKLTGSQELMVNVLVHRNSWRVESCLGALNAEDGGASFFAVGANGESVGASCGNSGAVGVEAVGGFSFSDGIDAVAGASMVVTCANRSGNAVVEDLSVGQAGAVAAGVESDGLLGGKGEDRLPSVILCANGVGVRAAALNSSGTVDRNGLIFGLIFIFRCEKIISVVGEGKVQAKVLTEAFASTYDSNVALMCAHVLVSVLFVMGVPYFDDIVSMALVYNGRDPAPHVGASTGVSVSFPHGPRDAGNI